MSEASETGEASGVSETALSIARRGPSLPQLLLAYDADIG